MERSRPERFEDRKKIANAIGVAPDTVYRVLNGYLKNERIANAINEYRDADRKNLERIKAKYGRR